MRLIIGRDEQAIRRVLTAAWPGS